MTIPFGWKLAPLEPTPEIIAAAAVAAWPTATEADIDLARHAAPIVLMQLNLVPGTTVELMATMLATMAPAYRAMLAAAPPAPDMSNDLRADYLADQHYLLGLRSGWNLGITGDNAKFDAAVAARGEQLREARRELREVAQPVAAAPAEPMYQAQFDGEYGSSVWRDVTEAAYHTFIEKHRRIVYAAPAAPVAHDEMLRIGAQMANTMYNLAQRAGEVIDSDLASKFDVMRKGWDAAVRAPAAAVTPPVAADDAKDADFRKQVAAALTDAKMLLELNGITADDDCDYGNGRADHIIDRMINAIDAAMPAQQGQGGGDAN